MPIYEEVAMSPPIMQKKIKAPSNSALMIGAGSLLGGLGGFFSTNKVG